MINWELEKNYQDGSFVALDLIGNVKIIRAVKKLLSPDGPFRLQSSRYTILEKQNLTSSRTESLALKKPQTQLALGFGVHTVQFKGFDLTVLYGLVNPSSTEEKMVIYCPKAPSKAQASIAPASTQTSASLSPPNSTPSSPAPIPASTGDGNGSTNDAPSQELAAETVKPEIILTARDVLDQFVTHANEHQHKTENDFVVILSLNEETLHWDTEIVRPKRPLESVILCAGVKEAIIQDIETFRNDKAFYRQHGIPYKRGYLIWGPPGCGKTSLISAVASKYDLTICPIPVANPKITDNVLISLLTSAPPDSILVLEDVDCIIPDIRSTKTGSQQGITFTGLINALDGVTSTEDKIVIMTTNYRNRIIAEALLRPGRVDKEFLITYADGNALADLFLQYYPGKKKRADLFKNFMVGRNIPTAYIQSYFLKHKGDPKGAWDNSQAFLEQYHADAKVTEERRRAMEDAIKKNEGGGLWG